MKLFLREILHNPLLWLLVFVPVVLVAQKMRHDASGRSAWFVGVLLIVVYSIFAMTLYLLPPRSI